MSTDPLTKLNILLVDDDIVVHSLLIEYINPLGHSLIWVQSGPECLEQVKEINPDVILLDLIMPDLSGLEVIQALRPELIASHVPIVILTANPNTTNIFDKYPIKPDYYLSKPFDRAALEEVLTIAMNSALVGKK
jgi:CheY-like chemotaxis protein